MLKSFSPSKIDVEIRCLSPENGGSIHLMQCFLKAMLNTLKTNRNFEVVHSYLALFLQVKLLLFVFYVHIYKFLLIHFFLPIFCVFLFFSFYKHT